MKRASLMILLLMSLNALAATYSSTQQLTIIIDPPPPCQLTVSDLDFGVVAVSKIDNSSYKKLPLRFVFSCSEVNQALTVKMKIVATALDDTTAQTSVPGLGVQFFVGNAVTPLPLNSDITNQGQPADVVARGLSIMPFIMPGESVEAGTFRAQMSLQMEYQ
ncbi:hypothetical protein CHU32_02970 [Superficieibacter electus]|uniref:Fimbrial-type adhesion domain-containing protein n=1 Tax=Superficieibacter electus TaxID=2022662 RepID=A0A2P5GV35_9ENTR|nr:fimbrial protein [Superficieibacter electus]POP44385.1 hypothetical protein CHU33_13080 [Superficieibacter electus]POP50403.1 hypothetical protein CHU32_02970 [Superficieibacter electus]